MLPPRLPPQPPPRRGDPPPPADEPPPKPRPVRLKAPRHLKPQTAIRYSKALDALDKKDEATAKKELLAVVQEQPDFSYASADLDKMLK